MSNPSQRQRSRRQFITDSARGACVMAVTGVGLAAYSSKSQGLDARALRPPGALDGDDFLSACVRCGFSVGEFFVARFARLI